MIGKVPWRKVVNTKNFMCCHSSILDWDDSAVEEAFHNAKKRFWAEMNGFSCDILLPDPDIYIDEIDWNPVIDPELMKELDREYFAPDEEGEGNEKVWWKNKKIRNMISAPSDGSNANLVDNVNPWECNNIETSGISESKENRWNNGWNQWNNQASVSKNVDNNENPWGCNVTQGDKDGNGDKWRDQVKKSWGHIRDGKDDKWGDQVKKSWGQNATGSHVNQSRNCDKSDCDKRNWDNNENPWDCGYQSFVPRKSDGWGSWDNACGWNHQESTNMENVDNTWVRSNQHGRAYKDRGWRNNGGDKRGGRYWNHYGNQNRGFESRRTGDHQEVWNGDFHNRDGSYQNISGYRNLSSRGDEYQRSWRRGNNKRRVSFA